MMESLKDEGYDEGYDEGLINGRLSGINETAKKMINDDIDIDTIVKYTGLSIEEINKLKIDN
jgi:predicted transposase/invertase (TIGR01784 family)